jgi:hypothetical protein
MVCRLLRYHDGQAQMQPTVQSEAHRMSPLPPISRKVMSAYSFRMLYRWICNTYSIYVPWLVKLHSHYDLPFTCVAMADRSRWSQRFKVNPSECCARLGLNDLLITWPPWQHLGLPTFGSASLWMQDGAWLLLNSMLCVFKCPVRPPFPPIEAIIYFGNMGIGANEEAK